MALQPLAYFTPIEYIERELAKIYSPMLPMWSASTLEELGFISSIVRITNSWYYQKKNTDTLIQIGEPNDTHENFWMNWDTTSLRNG